MPLTQDEKTAGFILAGGQSSRMGHDKALVSFAGRPLIANALSILAQAGLPATIAGGRPQLASFAPVVEDASPGLGPLSGICAALASTSARYAVFLSVDLPLLPASLLRFLVHHAQITGRAVTLSTVNAFAHTFPAVLDRAVLPALQAELAAGRRGCFMAFQAAAAALGQPISAIPVELLVQSAQADHPQALPAARWFLNVNTPADLELASKQVPLRIA
jgi:molybdopterin-guanine dinucleotide biosynthesis protein A